MGWLGFRNNSFRGLHNVHPKISACIIARLPNATLCTRYSGGVRYLPPPPDCSPTVTTRPDRNLTHKINNTFQGVPKLSTSSRSCLPGRTWELQNHRRSAAPGPARQAGPTTNSPIRRRAITARIAAVSLLHIKQFVNNRSACSTQSFCAPSPVAAHSTRPSPPADTARRGPKYPGESSRSNTDPGSARRPGCRS